MNLLADFGLTGEHDETTLDLAPSSRDSQVPAIRNLLPRRPSRRARDPLAPDPRTLVIQSPDME